jgi:hypothetical protein
VRLVERTPRSKKSSGVRRAVVIVSAEADKTL